MDDSAPETGGDNDQRVSMENLGRVWNVSLLRSLQMPKCRTSQPFHSTWRYHRDKVLYKYMADAVLHQHSTV